MNEMKPAQEGESATEGQMHKDELVLNTDSMDRFVKVFEASARRWELVIYPGLRHPGSLRFFSHLHTKP